MAQPPPALIRVIQGPTAGGKSAQALALAEALDGVVINADSMQVYDALPLLTARPEAQDLARAPHALYGFLAPDDPCTAQRWREAAAAVIRTALADGCAPIVVGGTGLYIAALMDGFSPVPPVPPDIRARTAALYEELGRPAFYAHLAQRDPVMAARLSPNDTQRLLRAWEVLEATGQSLSAWQSLPSAGPPAPHWRFAVEYIEPPRAILHDRIAQRFAVMMDRGVMEEIAAFAARLDSGALPADVPLSRAIGFRPLRAALRGEISREEAVARAAAETRQYARRQITWFRNRGAKGNEKGLKT